MSERLAQSLGEPSHPQLHDLSSSAGKPKKRRFWKVGKAVTAISHLFGEYTPLEALKPNEFCLKSSLRFCIL